MHGPRSTLHVRRRPAGVRDPRRSPARRCAWSARPRNHPRRFGIPGQHPAMPRPPSRLHSAPQPSACSRCV